MSSLLLDRIDAVPLAADNFSDEYKAWVTVLVDSINSIVDIIDNIIINPVVLTTTSVTALTDTTYIIGNAGTTTVTLPLVSYPGDIIGITGQGAGGWLLATNILVPGQTIYVSNNTASTSVGSAEQYDSITVQCVVANTIWVATAGFTTGYIYT